MTNIPYSLPQEELVKLFSRSCNMHIYFILQIQIHSTLKDALAQVEVIEEVKI